MQFKNYDELKKAIKSEQIAPIYLFFGIETYFMKKAVNLILSKVVNKSFANFNLQIFSGDNVTINDLESACEALPMMAPKKCVVMHDLNLEKLTKSDFHLFISLLQNPNPNTVLIIYFTNLSLDVKKNAKTKKVYDIINKNGVVLEFAQKDKSSLKKDIADLCKKQNTPISPVVCEKIIDYVGSDFSTIVNEVNKLIAYVNTREITVDDVKLLCIQSVTSTAFDLSNAILRGNYNQAFTILDKLCYLKTEPLMILGALNMSFIDLYRIKSAQNSGFSSQDVIADFKYRSAYRVTKLFQDVSKFSIEQIRECIEILEKADVLMKSSKLDNRIILEQILGEMMSIQLHLKQHTIS